MSQGAVDRNRKSIEKQQEFLANYFEKYRAPIFDASVRTSLVELADLMKDTAASGRKVVFAGNGGSAAIAAHCAVDFSKNAKVRSLNFGDASLVTCLANDCGYEQWLEKASELYLEDGDLAVMTHHIWLLAVCDLIIGEAEYPAS